MPNGTVELTPEAIEEYISASQALLPRYEPPAAPPQMQFVTGATDRRLPEPPPVPLPLRPVERFTATSAPPVFDPLEQMREQINAIKFKTAQEAYDAAERFQAMRAYHRDLEAGRDPNRWLPLIFKKNPTAIPGMMRERRLEAPPKVFTAPGLPAGVQYGGRIAFPPASAMPKPPLSTDVTEFTVPGSTNVFARGVEIGPGRRQVFPAKAEPSMTPAQTEAALRRAIDHAEKEISGLPTSLKELTMVPEADRQKQLDAANARREELKREIDAFKVEHRKLLPGGTKPDAASTAKKLTADTAREFLKRAGGDKEKARQLAKDAGYEF